MVEYIDEAIKNHEDDQTLNSIKEKIKNLCKTLTKK